MLPIIVVWVSVEIFYRTVPNNYTFKNELIKIESDSVEVLIFGDSHTFYGLNPKYFSKRTLNLANVSQTIYFDKLLFEKHADNTDRLKCIIIPIEYTTFSQVDNSQEDYWRKYFYSTQMELDVPSIKWYDIKQYSLTLTQKLGKTGSYLKTFINDKTLIGCDKNGWGNTYATAVDSVELKRLAKLISRKHDDGSKDFTINLNRIKDIITKCNEKNIQVILVNMPVSQPYLELLNQEEVKAISAISKELDETYSNVLNVNLLYDDRFIQGDFHDADHLNINGAQKCSVILNNIIQKL